MNPLSGQSTFNFAGIGQTNLTNQIQTAQPQSQPQSNLFGNLFQKPANNLLTGQNPQTQNSLFPTQNNQQTNLGQGGISQNIPNVANQNVSHDFLRSKLLTHKISKESQDEMYSKLVKDYSEFSKNNSIKNKLQLESLDLNLDCLDHMILPDYLKFKKSLFQLLALTDNDKKDIYKNTNLDITKAQTFLSDQGINLTKIDKDINELKNYLISNYDFSSDLNNINLSDKNIIDDKVKMHLNTTTNSLWARTNENLIFADNNQRRSNNLNYFKKIIKFQNSEMEFLNDMGLFSTPYGNGGYNPKSSAEKFTSNFNYDENNKYNYSANLQNFNLINSEYGKKVNFQSNIDNFKSNQSQINKFPSRQGQENLKNFNPSNFTPLKVMNLNFANAGFGMNKIKNLNKLSSSNKQTGQDFYNLANKKTEILKKIYAGGTYNQYSNSSMENYNVNDYQNLNSNTNINKTNNKANFSTLDYIENLKMINFKNFAGAEADGNKVAQFSSYFDNLKTYFYYKVKSEIIIENQPLLITNSDLENFYSIKEEQLKNNILPMTIAINKLCLFFEQTKDFSRKNLFSLLYCQIRCLNKNFKNSNLTPENVLYNTIKFYESEFLKKILLNVDTPLLKNKSEIDIYNMDFEFKFSCVEKFATNLLLQNFSSKINSNIPNFNLYQNQGAFGYDKYSKADLEKMKKWTIIYVFIRAGLIKDCVIYISSIIKNFYENQSFEGNYNRDNDIEPFLELLKQIYSDTKIDENLYSLLSDSMKNKNLRDEEPFKFCCLNLILKINNPINENVFLNFEDYIWYHLNLIFKKKNFLELTEKKFLNLKYLSLAEFQTFVLNSDPNIFNTKNSPNFNLDYATCLFSLLLFEEGLEFILNSQTNIIDGVNIGFILTEINLCKNFCDEELYYELTEFRCYQKTDSLKAKINSFINKISDKRKLIEILLYIKYIFYDQDSQQWLDLFKNTINLFSDYNVLFNGDNVFIAVEDKKIFMKDLLTQAENQKLIDEILSQAIMLYDQNPTKSINFDELIKLAKMQKSYEKLIDLIIRDSIEVINSKYSRVILNQNIKSNIHVSRIIPKNVFNEKYKKILDEIKFDYDKLNTNVQYNIKTLRQLENIEEVLNILETQGVSKALNEWISKVSIIPYKSEEEIEDYIKRQFNELFDIFQEFIPNVIGILFYLLTNRKIQLFKEGSSKNSEFSDIEKHIRNLDLLVSNLSKNNNIKNTEGFNILKEKMNEYNHNFQII